MNFIASNSLSDDNKYLYLISLYDGPLGYIYSHNYNITANIFSNFIDDSGKDYLNEKYINSNIVPIFTNNHFYCIINTIEDGKSILLDYFKYKGFIQLTNEQMLLI